MDAIDIPYRVVELTSRSRTSVDKATFRCARSGLIGSRRSRAML